MRGRDLLWAPGLALLAVVVSVSSCSRGSLVDPAGQVVTDGSLETTGRDRSMVQVRSFDELVESLDESFVYGPTLGVNFEDLRNRYRSQVIGASPERYESLMRNFIAELPDGAASWQSRDERIEIQSSASSSYEGIGAYVSYRESPRPRIVLLSVMRDSPAWAAGLRGHDAILSIDGIPVTREEGSEAVMRIRGLAGTPVRLTVRTPFTEPRNVIVTRGRVDLARVAEPVVASILDSRIGYMRLPRSANANVTSEVVSLLQQMEGQGPITGLVLDLRISSAANWPLGEMLTIFGNGDMGASYTAGGEQPINVEGQNVAGSQTLPLVLVIGPDTEGLPEIFAGAIQASGRARVVGRSTGGRIEREAQIMLADGSRAYVVTSSFRTRTGRDIGLEGVQPDVRTAADWDEVSNSQDPVIQRAAAELAGGV